MNVFLGTGSNEVKQATFPIFMEKTTAGLWGAKSFTSSHMTARSSVNFFSSALDFGGCGFCAKIHCANKRFKPNINIIAYLNFMVLYEYESSVTSDRLMIISKIILLQVKISDTPFKDPLNHHKAGIFLETISFLKTGYKIVALNIRAGIKNFQDG